MSGWAIAQSVVTAIVLAFIFYVTKALNRLDTLEVRVEPVITWYVKTSMDALKIATNPTSEQLSKLADKYIANVMGKGRITSAEKQELIDGLLEIYREVPEKKQAASISLRFIEGRERMLLLPH